MLMAKICESDSGLDSFPGLSAPYSPVRLTITANAGLLLLLPTLLLYYAIALLYILLPRRPRLLLHRRISRKTAAPAVTGARA